LVNPQGLFLEIWLTSSCLVMVHPPEKFESMQPE
jgi:hypothetical protein